MTAPTHKPPFALMAEFQTSQELIQAIRASHEAGYTKLEAYTPYPIEEVWEELGHHRSWLPLIVLIGGIFGCLGGFFLQYWASVINYPLNVGGRPLINKLPMPHHPVFGVERFARASQDRYFLAIAAWDPHFDRVETEQFLQTLTSQEVALVQS
jgi:hypothetical protein